MHGAYERTGTDPQILSLTQGLVSYVRELVRSRHKPVRNCDRYSPLVWLAELPEGTGPLATHDDEVLLRLDHVPRRLHPPLPEILHGWIDTKILDKPAKSDPELAEKGPGLVEVQQEDGSTKLTTTLVGRNERIDVLRAYQEWVVRWRQWATGEMATEPRRRLYTAISRMARQVVQADDVYEVVLGVGLIAKETPGQPTLARHLVTKKLTINTDRSTARITVALASDSPARFEDRDFLDADDGYSLQRSEQLRTDLAALDPHPLADDTTRLLARWADIALDVGVRFNTRWERQPLEDAALNLSLTPAIFLRERDANALVQYYDRIAASLTGSHARSPLGLAQLIAPLEKEERLAWGEPGSLGHAEKLEREPLFPLATNEAQRDVLDRLRSDTAVVVQGPPGTGKTHTIANLICALLAQGYRVLVTSQKDQALQVLRDKLPPPIRDLCVLLTGLQRGGSDELERSITALSNHASSSSPDAVARSIAHLDEQRGMLLSSRTRLREDIHALREAEWVEHPEIAPGYSGTLATVTRQVMANRQEFGWLPPLPSDHADVPMSTQAVLELRTLLVSATPERRARRDQRLPELERLPAADAFSDLLLAAQRYERMAADAGEPGRTLSGLSNDALAEIGVHLGKAAAALHFLGMPQRASEWDPTNWLTKALTDRFAGRQQALWRRVSASAHLGRTAQDSLDALGMRHVHVPPVSVSEAASMLRAGLQLRDHLASGGRLRQHFTPAVQRAAQPLLDACTVDGQSVAQLADLDAVLTWLDAQVKTAELTERWASVGVRIEVSGDQLPVALSALADLSDAMSHIEEVVAARDAIDRLLVARGIHLTLLASPQGWDTFSQDVANAQSLHSARRGHASLEELQQQLPPLSPSDPPELTALRLAVASQDAGRYAAALSRLHLAYQEQEDQRRCDELLGQLRSWHPALAEQLSTTAPDADWERRLARWPEAWAWATAMKFCVRMRDTGRGGRLQQEFDETEWQLARVTEELAAARAWLHCLTRISQEQRQALQSYRSAMSSLGKGTGRYAPRHRRAARDAMAIAQDAVPAWIMPLQKVVETIPPTPDAFDVVIVDEASQAGLDALFLLWLAPRVIVVGDDKQCAPSFAIQEHQKIFDRLDAYLPDLRPAFRDDFRPGNNLYQLLSARFPDVVRLLEHFRCMPEIIGWSSAQFYEPPLQPLRQFGADRLDPLKVVTVDGGYTEGRDQRIRNPLEAKLLVEKLREMLADPAYANKTFGAIALQGTGQVRLIEDLILESMDPAIMERHEIRVGAPPDFQGDERDVMLLSMVVVDPPRALTRTEEQRRFNVAASRARDQMWLFASVSRGRLNRDDLRFSLLSYMENPPSFLGESLSAEEVSSNTRQAPFESLFEQRVFLAIRRRGYHVIPQFKVSGRRIDLVVSGTNGRLAVECDGRVAHSTPAQVRSDMDRERELRRVGWEFWRVRESEFYFDQEQALASLWEELDRRGIRPGVHEHLVGSESSSWSPVELPAEDAPVETAETDG
jgi:very-short-patch-repair endonuclease